MIGELKSAYDSAKMVVDIAQGIQSLKTETAINQAVIDIQRHVLETQRGLTAAEQIHADDLKRIDALEQKIMGMENWKAESQRYELADTGQGSLAYSVKVGMENGEPAHWICPNCYQQGKKSIMKPETLSIGRADLLVCHPCGFDVVTHGVRTNQNPPKANFGRAR